jgi:predicted permease
MRSLKRFFTRLGNWATRRRDEERLKEEIEEHLALQTAENLRAGLPPAEARRQAVVKFCGVEGIKEEYWAERGIPFIETSLQDTRYGLRMLRKSPGFTAVAVLTLALGIGANTAMFSVVEGVLLSPLPYRQPDRLVVIWENNLTLKHFISPSYPDFRDWQRSSRSLEQFAALTWQSYDLTGPGTPDHVDGKLVSSGFFSALGVNLALGREFSPEEDKHGGAPVVIISDRLRKDRFAPGSQVLNKSVVLNGVAYTIAGVLPPGFQFIDNADVYTPLGQGNPLYLDDRSVHAIFGFARLKPGVSVAQAQSEMNAVQDNLVRLYPAIDQGLGIQIDTLKQVLVGDVRGTLLLLLGAVGLVLLIACANVANLLLARSAARTREFAVRFALGANRARIIRQLVTETVLLSLASSGLGLVIAKPGLSAVLAAVPGGLPRTENISVNAHVLLFTFAVSMAVGILFGLAPALKSSKTVLQASLKEGGRGSSGTHHRAQSTLVVVQVALALIILVGAGLLFRSIRRLWHADPGFALQHTFTFKVGLSPMAVKTPEGQRNAFRQLTERVREIPGVEAADLTALVPLSQRDNAGPFWVGLQAPASIAQAPRATFYWIGPDYLRVMSIPLLRGRFFTPQDTTNTERVIAIDSDLARSYFPDKDPVGQTMMIPHWGSVRVVGVVGHVSHWDLADTSRYTQNQIYASFYQLPDRWVPVFYGDMRMAVRTPLDLAAVLPAIKAAVFAVGSDQTVYDVQSMQAVASASMSQQRLPMVLLGAFACLALALASIGIYGVISYSIAQRIHEIGIRIALGAERSDVLRLVIGQGLRLALAGVAIGEVVTLVLARLLSSFSSLLYGVGASDPATLAAVSFLLAGVTVLACYVPARRAMRVDPMVALRYE